MSEKLKNLFPSATKKQPSSLFPSTSTSATTHSDPPQASWLQNSSFPQHLVKTLNAVTSGNSQHYALIPAPIPAPIPGPIPGPVSATHGPPKYECKRRKAEKSSHKSDRKKKKKQKKELVDKSDKLKFDLFELLFKGDKNNYRYGSLYAYDIPTYKTFIKHCVGDTKFAYSKLASHKPSQHDPASRYFAKLKAPELTLQYRSKFLRLDADYISLTVSSQCWEPTEPVLAAMDPSKSDPYSEAKWIQFIDSTGRTKAGLERRYDICQKARKFLPNNIEILKKTTETAKQYMSNEQIGRVWTDLLFHHPNKIELWEEYLAFKETNLTELSFNSVVAAYRKCFATLFGFHSLTFRSHTFEGDVDTALILVAARFIKFLSNMGYEEKVYSYHSSLLELSTSGKSQAEYLKWWDCNYTCLGSKGYVDWWSNNVLSEATESISNISQIPDIWSTWLQEERRKDELCSGPVNRSFSPDLVDRECCVSSVWLNQFLFISCKPEHLFETLFRSYLPDHLNNLPLVALFHCNDVIFNQRTVDFLSRLCEQLYRRYSHQATIGVIWTLLEHVKSSNDRSTAKFTKGLLKSAQHRNNMIYWSLFIHFSADVRGVIDKLLSTPLSSYYTTVLENKLASCQRTDSHIEIENKRGTDGEWDVDRAGRQIEEIMCKPTTSSSETLHLGSHVTNVFCKKYRFNPSPTSLADFITELSTCEMSSDQYMSDMFVLFHHILSCEVQTLDPGHCSSLKKVALLAVEQFPQIQWFWEVLCENISLTSKVWERLLKSSEETLWLRRVRVESEKQEDNPDINLRNRIISLAGAAVENFPQSALLWDQYITVTQKYDKKSLKSVLIRAIKENPSRKRCYLQAVELCSEEAETIYELIEEKEIRLRTLIEEIQMFALDAL